MRIKTLPMGLIQANCYLLLDEVTGEAAVIDPGEDSPILRRALRDESVRRVKYILLTHGHFDHILGAYALKQATGAPVGIHPADALCLEDEHESLADQEVPGEQNPLEADFLLREGTELSVGELKLRVIETPGHTKGGVCFVCGDVIFSGDTLFRHTYGRTDLPGGDPEELFASLDKLFVLPGDYTVFPGHNRATTLAEERTVNRYVRRRP